MRARSLLLIGLAGAGVACGEQTAPPVAQQSMLPETAEQLLYGVNFVLTDAGVRRAMLKARTMLMFDEGTRTEMSGVHTTFFTEAGVQNAVLTSDEGSYHVRLQTMEARGNVVVVTTDGRKLETPQLRYDPSRNEVSSDSAFRMTDPDRVTEGVGFVSDPDLTTIRILKAAKMSGQSVIVPKR